MDDSDPWLTQVKRGIIEMAILNVLAGEAMHGYRLVRMLAEVPGLVVTEGTIYPLLSRLLSEGMVIAELEASAQGPARKVYALSPQGRRRRTAMAAAWKRIVAAIDRLSATPGDRT